MIKCQIVAPVLLPSTVKSELKDSRCQQVGLANIETEAQVFGFKSGRKATGFHYVL